MSDNSGYISYVELTGFAGALDDEYFKKKEVKNNSEVFGQSNWMTRGSIHSDEEHLGKEGSRLCACECGKGVEFKNSVLDRINVK